MGNYSGTSSVEDVERSTAFHVFNLKPDTTSSELQLFLSKSFNNVQCEALNSHNPERYSSFKVIMPCSEVDKALIASNWPSNACVRYFSTK